MTQEIKDKAKALLNDFEKSGYFDKEKTKDIIEAVSQLDDRITLFAEQAQLACIVYDHCFEATESFAISNIGVDLAYLLGAICRNGFVRWERRNLPQLYFVLKKFSKDHPVWQHIAIFDEEKNDVVKIRGENRS